MMARLRRARAGPAMRHVSMVGDIGEGITRDHVEWLVQILGDKEGWFAKTVALPQHLPAVIRLGRETRVLFVASEEPKDPKDVRTVHTVFGVHTEASLDFGPPRMCHSMDVFNAEIVRQQRLVSLGYIRRIRHTYGWRAAEASNGKLVWHWVNSNHGYISSKHVAFEDHELAWKEDSK
jgi:hypothetical protein